MSDQRFGEWQPMTSAPRDGSRVLVEIRASEQGPAEVDMARWAQPERGAEACWISADSDPAAPVVYADDEVSGWMPLPSPLPRLKLTRSVSKPKAVRDADEISGSGI